MSTEYLANISTILPNSRTTAQGQKANPSKDATIEKRQDVAANGKDIPSELVQNSTNSRDTETGLDSAVDEINTFVQTIDRKLHFSVDESLPLGRAVIKVIDSETDQVIREIPSEEALALARKINEQVEEYTSLEGLMFTDQA